MTRRWLGLLVLAVAGCDAVEPWVSERPAGGPPPLLPCPHVAECALLDERAGHPDGEISPPEPRCRDGLAPHTLAVTRDTRIDAASLACVELSIEVEEGDTPLVVTVEGDALSRAHVRLRSAARPLFVRLDVGSVRDATLEGEGPISIVSTGAELERARIEVRASRAVASPELRIEGGAHQDVAITLPIGLLRVHGGNLVRAHLEVEQLAARGLDLAAGTVHAEIAELIGVELTDTTLEIGDLAAGGGDWSRVELARCGALFLSHVRLRASRLSACEGEAVLDEVEAERCAFGGTVRGELGYYLACAFGGEAVELRSRIHRSALCGVARVAATELVCVRCEPVSPPEVCGLVDGDTALCPGVCDAACEDGTLWFGGASCRPPDA